MALEILLRSGYKRTEQPVKMAIERMEESGKIKSESLWTFEESNDFMTEVERERPTDVIEIGFGQLKKRRTDTEMCRAAALNLGLNAPTHAARTY